MKKQTRKTPKHRGTQALVRQTLDAFARRRRPAAVTVLPPAPMTLGDDISIGDVGIVDVKLTAEEEAILNEPVALKDIQIKASGQPYISHPAYTRWMNRAFGRLGWAIVPRSKPMKTDKSVVCAYVLYIHGKPAAFAMGEQEYFENNRDQTYGDALEATVASALRRCAKRLGIGLELWDKRYLDAFVHEHCIVVKVTERGGGYKRVWRRIDDPPFWNEIDDKKKKDDREADNVEETQRRERPAETRPARAAGHHAKRGEPISQGQRQRLWTIARNAGRTEEELKAWLLSRYGLNSSRDISRNLYDQICRAVEQRGDLPAREAGEEG